jgi:type II secretory pathway component PulF
MTERGQSLSNSMQAVSQVPSQIIPLVRVGEQNSELPAAMTVIHELLEGQIMLRSRLLSMILPPFVFLIVAVVACALVFALFLPLMGLFPFLSMTGL